MPRSSKECSTICSEGVFPAELDRANVTVEPPRDPAHGDLATNAAMVLAKAAGTNPRALAEAIKPKLEALPPVTSVEIAGPGFINIRLTPTRGATSSAPSSREGDEYGLSTSARTSGSMSNMSRPTRPGRCTWAIAAARWSATASRGCSRRRASGSPRNIMSTTPARRSTRSPVRCTCGTAKRSARTSATSPRACTRAIISSRSARRSPRNMATNMSAVPESEWLPAVPRRGDRGDARPHPPRSRPARHPPR